MEAQQPAQDRVAGGTLRKEKTDRANVLNNPVAQINISAISHYALNPQMLAADENRVHSCDVIAATLLRSIESAETKYMPYARVEVIHELKGLAGVKGVGNPAAVIVQIGDGQPAAVLPPSIFRQGLP